jgi:hypothetical protein
VTQVFGLIGNFSSENGVARCVVAEVHEWFIPGLSFEDSLALLAELVAEYAS